MAETAGDTWKGKGMNQTDCQMLKDVNQMSERFLEAYRTDPVIYAAISVWQYNDDDTRTYCEVLETIAIMLSDQGQNLRSQLLRELEQLPSLFVLKR
jgi:hypothetical protein